MFTISAKRIKRFRSNLDRKGNNNCVIKEIRKIYYSKLFCCCAEEAWIEQETPYSEDKTKNPFNPCFLLYHNIKKETKDAQLELQNYFGSQTKTKGVKLTNSRYTQLLNEWRRNKGKPKHPKYNPLRDILYSCLTVSQD